MILLPKDHAPERKESFYARVKVSAFANEEEEEEEDGEIGDLAIFCMPLEQCILPILRV